MSCHVAVRAFLERSKNLGCEVGFSINCFLRIRGIERMKLRPPNSSRLGTERLRLWIGHIPGAIVHFNIKSTGKIFRSPLIHCNLPPPRCSPHLAATNCGARALAHFSGRLFVSTLGVYITGFAVIILRLPFPPVFSFSPSLLHHAPALPESLNHLPLGTRMRCARLAIF